ncbi:MAG: LamG domain-containing protein [Armatimonadota bacterium]|nr:LamG domain-containing protein [Armatimonadota bacterium]
MLRMMVAPAVVAVIMSSGWCADMDDLRESVEWLRTERLRGTLYHDPSIEPMPRIPLQSAEASGRRGAPQAVTLAGWHHLVVLPDEGRIRLRLRDVPTDAHFEGSIWAVFDPAGNQLQQGEVQSGEEALIEVPAEGDEPHVVVLNRGPASNSVAEVTVLSRHWSIDGKPRRAYNRTPLHYHFLRDLKLGGFNVALVDFERLEQEFMTDEGLEAWTDLVRGWTDYAEQQQFRVMPTFNIGGSDREVEAWGDAPKGLYIEPDPDLPLAPCPVQRVFWERLFLRRAKAIARLSLENPYVVGIGLDPEMYRCWQYGHYMLSGTCFCDHCMGGFLEAEDLETDVLEDLETGKERHEWLQQQELMGQYYDYLAEEMTEIAQWCRDEVHAINPDLLLNMFVIDIGNWFCEGIARGFSRLDLPVVNFCEHTYYSVGYDPEWLAKVHERYRQWGANVLQGSALWDLHFPATEARFMPAHAYNLAINDEGWWYWPGDQLYRDYGARYAYLDQPAYFEQYWDGCVWANREIERKTEEPEYQSPLAEWEVVPWKGQIKRGVIEAEPDVLRRQSEPSLPVRVAEPATLYFVVPERCERFEVIVQARGEGNGGAVIVRDPAGHACANERGEMDRPERLEVEVTGPGVWSVEVRAEEGLTLHDVGLRFETLPTMLSPEPAALLAPETKKPGLIGHWPMDEGEGRAVADVSQPPPYNGRMRDAEWGEGILGSCLCFDGTAGRVDIAAEYSYHNLRRFTLSAWVKLAGLPEQGNGNSIVNKGPEAPVQHFWWWIGYPPEHTLILEMGSEEHQYGAGFASDPLEWELGRWYHVAAVFECDGERSTVTHYRDGEMVGEQTRDEVFHTGAYDMKIGSYHGANHWMNGCIDEVKLWDRGLSAGEVRAEYERVRQ